MAQLIAKLEKKKLEAVATERFEYAKKIKSAIGEIINNGLVMSLAPKLLCPCNILSQAN